MEVFPSCRARATRSSWPRAGCRAAARPLALRAPPASPSGGRPAGGSPTRAREYEHKVRGVRSFGFFAVPPGPVARDASYPGDCHDPRAGDATISKVRRGNKCGSRFTAFPGELRKVIAPSFRFVQRQCSEFVCSGSVVVPICRSRSHHVFPGDALLTNPVFCCLCLLPVVNIDLSRFSLSGHCPQPFLESEAAPPGSPTAAGSAPHTSAARGYRHSLGSCSAHLGSVPPRTDSRGGRRTTAGSAPAHLGYFVPRHRPNQAHAQSVCFG